VRPFSILLACAWLSSGLILNGCQKNEETADQGATTGGTVAQSPNDTGSSTMGTTGSTAETTTSATPMGTPSGATATASNLGVTAKIKNAINLSNVIDHDKSKINVDTTDSEVILRGGIASEKERQEAIKLAKANAGGRKVVDQLTGGTQP
jgi:osmotically-inducible protein OsmY